MMRAAREFSQKLPAALALTRILALIKAKGNISAGVSFLSGGA